MRKSLLALTLLSLTISTGTFAQQQQQRSGHAGRAGGLQPRRSASLPQANRPGRFRDPRLLAAESRANIGSLQPGAEKPRAVTGAEAAASAGMPLQALVLAAYSPIWGARSLACAGVPWPRAKPMNVASN